MKSLLFPALLLAVVPPAFAATAPVPPYSVSVPGLSVGLSVNGEISGPLRGLSEVAGCRNEGKADLRKLESGGYAVTRQLADAQGRRCRLTDTFRPTKDSIRWEIEIVGEGEPWSAPITASLRHQTNPETLFWTAWDSPPQGDLLTSAPLAIGRTYSYGAPRFTMEKPGIPWYNCALRPNGEHYISMPLVTMINPGQAATSLIVSPEPMLLDMELLVDKSGRSAFTWYRHRIAKATPLRLALDIVPHEPGWRGGLRWMTARYPQYFNPPNPTVETMAGSANYALENRNLNLTELRKMGFTFNWVASFDFPYMGMFLPPVARDTEWKPFKGPATSIAKMNDYAAWMRQQGFHVLNYFNVTEFGAKVVYPPKPNVPEVKPDWKDSNQFLYKHLSDAILHVPEKLQLPAKIKWPDPMWAKTRPGGLYYTWQEGVGMDCGEPVYRDFLLDQAKRHVTELPASSGICIDRMDWLRFYNLDRDDCVTWFDGAPARSLLWSWRTFMDRLGPIMHDSDKVIFANPLVKRLELLRHVDGIYDEIPGTNGDALMGLRKPVLIFNGPVKDPFLQECLYLGIHPMCPLPGNDHGLGWGNPAIRKPFLDYGPLLTCMRGKKWVLEPDCVATTTPGAKVNLFEVPGGYALPVIRGGKATSATVRVRNLKNLGKLSCDALHPGIDAPQPVSSNLKDGVLELTVPLARGCAMVRLRE